MKKIILTGADGFIGRNLIKEFVQQGYVIYAIVQNIDVAKGIIKDVRNIKMIKCDMNNYYDLLSYEELKDSYAVLHFAWAGVSDFSKQGYEDQLNNVKCACDLLNVTKALGIKKFLFAGSLMEYEHMKAYENGFFNVSMRNIYHVAKNAARNMLQIIANNNNIDYYLVTISNVYGVGEKSARLINTAMRNMITGTRMGFTAAEQMYDFIYIEDAARAIRYVMEGGIPNKDYYIGNDKQKQLKEFLIEMRDIIDPAYELRLGEIPFKGVSLNYDEFDTKGLYVDLDFKPNYDFKTGIIKTVEWIRGGEVE